MRSRARQRWRSKHCRNTATKHGFQSDAHYGAEGATAADVRETRYFTENQARESACALLFNRESELQQERLRIENSYQTQVDTLTSELRAARERDLQSRTEAQARKHQVQTWAPDFAEKMRLERVSIVRELREAKQQIRCYEELGQNPPIAGDTRGRQQGEHRVLDMPWVAGQDPAGDFQDNRRHEMLIGGGSGLSAKRICKDGGKGQRPPTPPGLDMGIGVGKNTHEERRNQDDASTESPRRRGTVKGVTLPSIPTATGFRKWQQDMYVQVCAASKRWRG